MRSRILAVFLFLCASVAWAQFTVVTGTVIDPNSLPYSGGTITAQLVIAGVTPTLSGGSFSMTGSAGLNPAGKFTMRLADSNVMSPHLQWSFTVCSGSGSIQPAGGTGPQCFTPAPITITGPSQDISVQLQAAALALSAITGGGALPPSVAFLATNIAGTGVAAGCLAGQVAAGDLTNKVACQSKPVIDVRDVFGVDCTGTTDSSAALNAMWDTRLGGNINGKTVSFKPNCSIRVDHPLVIYSQSYFVLDGGGKQPTADNGAVIFGCGTDTGAVLQIARSGHAEIRGLSVVAKGLSCTSGFTGSVLLDNEVSGGVTTTDIRMIDDDFDTNRAGTTIPNYVGVQIGRTTAAQNLERIEISNSSILCGSSSSGSIGILGNGGNSDHDIVLHNDIAQCYIGISGFLGGTIAYNNFSDGSFSTFGSGGSTIRMGGCPANQLTLLGNELAENSGQFYVQVPGAGCQNVTMMENIMNTTALDPAVNAIDVGNGINRLTLINNSFTMISGNTQPTIGSSTYLSPATIPNTDLVEFGNTSNTGLITRTLSNGLASFSGLQNILTKPVIFAARGLSNSSTLGVASPPVTLRAKQWNGADTNYDFTFGATTSRTSGGQFPTFYIDRISPNTTGTLALMTPLSGGLTTAALTWGTNTATVAHPGVAGTTSYSYVVVAVTSVGGAPSPVATTTTGNATLDTNNYNTITWYPIGGAAEYCVYRSASAGTPSSTGLIGCLSAGSLGQVAGGYQFADTGLVADGTTTPVTNTADGRIVSPAQIVSTLATGTGPFSTASSTASATTAGGGLNVSPSLSSDPATCVVGQLYWNTSTPVEKYCSAANTWTAFGAGNLVNPMTTLGDIIYENATPVPARLAGPTATNGVPQTLISTPSAGAATSPVWAPGGVPTNPQTGASYTVAATDRANYLSFSNAGAIAITLPQAGTTGFASNFVFVACDIGAGTATITPTTSTISFTTGSAYTSAGASMALTTGQCAWIYSDNSNYFAIRR